MEPYSWVVWRIVILKEFLECKKKKTVGMLTRSQRYARNGLIFAKNYILKLSSIPNFEYCKFIHCDFYKNRILV